MQRLRRLSRSPKQRPPRMASSPARPGTKHVRLENFETALLWKAKQLQFERYMTLSETCQFLMWLGLMHLGETRTDIREAFEEYVAAQQKRDEG